MGRLWCVLVAVQYVECQRRNSTIYSTRGHRDEPPLRLNRLQHVFAWEEICFRLNAIWAMNGPNIIESTVAVVYVSSKDMQALARSEIRMARKTVISLSQIERTVLSPRSIFAACMDTRHKGHALH